MGELRNAKRLRHVAKRIFCNDAVFFLAQNEADTRFVARMAKQIVDGGKIEVHLAGVFRFERTTFQIEDHKAPELQVVEQKIDSVVLACDLKRNLSANEREADAQLKEKLLNVAYKAGLQLSFVSILGKGEEIEIVGVLEKLLGKIRLRLWSVVRKLVRR